MTTFKESSRLVEKPERINFRYALTFFLSDVFWRRGCYKDPPRRAAPRPRPRHQRRRLKAARRESAEDVICWLGAAIAKVIGTCSITTLFNPSKSLQTWRLPNRTPEL